MEILTLFVIILEILFLFFIISKENNLYFKKIYETMGKNFVKRSKLEIEFRNKRFDKKSYIIFFAIFLFSLFLDTKMITIIFISFIMFFLLKLQISYEKFSKVFINYNPNVKKYNFYLLFILFLQVATIILTFFISR
ncbi:hypothetical protein [Leptotrichia sp. oral taxon 847]|uniref:hypothetical protein n=1 Tax=Leptotrichia sp. oral taxon 847 TaxID=1785996 RepID=UPI0007681F1C|nr:hypothetical protein [Leptotrichia sp. oral taxon 847]AMD94818.1 hypothetical protein AXF11_03905 [Leptotrichia sp. oral taxon 847]